VITISKPTVCKCGGRIYTEIQPYAVDNLYTGSWHIKTIYQATNPKVRRVCIKCEMEQLEAPTPSSEQERK